jgi:outer membrane scaffolding protein for murein synthesis (MipA/OmpV family)
MRKRFLTGVAAAALCGALAGETRAQSLGGLFADDLFTDATELVSDLMDTFMPGVTNVRLGLGPVVGPDYEGSDGYDANVAPLISLRYKDLIQVDNNNIRVNLFGEDGALWKSTNFRAGPMLKLDFGRSAKDSPDLTGLGNVGTAVELGGFVSYATGPLRYRLRLRHDVASGHKGMLADADISLAVYRSKTLSIASRLGTTWASKKYMRSYFGVSAAQAAAAGLPVFAAGSGVKDVTLSVASEIRVTPRWAVVLDAGASRLMGDAKASPIVRLRGSPNQFSAGAYAVYSF